MSIDPHTNDPNEDPEEHLGDEIPDPWDDDDQADWVTSTVSLDPDTEDV